MLNLGGRQDFQRQLSGNAENLFKIKYIPLTILIANILLLLKTQEIISRNAKKETFVFNPTSG